MKHSKLKKRLRKKLHIGEFQDFGFRIRVRFRPDFSESDADKFWSEFIGEIERHHLAFGGGGDTESLKGFVEAQKKHESPTPAQREAIEHWLESREEISECEVGNLVDAWYDVE